MSLALEELHTSTGATLGCSRARDIFGTAGPSSKKTTCSFSYRFGGNPGIRGLCQTIRVAKLPHSRELAVTDWPVFGLVCLVGCQTLEKDNLARFSCNSFQKDSLHTCIYKFRINFRFDHTYTYIRDHQGRAKLSGNHQGRAKF